MANVYLSLGSNIEREANLCSAMQRLRQDFGHVVFSHVYETPAAGFAGEPFFNLAAGLTTALTPTALKHYLRELEQAHGRLRGEEKFSARTLDIDLLLYDDWNLQPTTNLPHQDILTYAFVLFPLAEIASTVMHPVLQRAIGEIARESTLSAAMMRHVTLNCGA
ncbi:2-amino-4-hydroxy-6-hydroxymethyldihydropteridine diphosphokinase [Thiothrix subterranea]|uniref:2-amino-4-hydroxy-6- hydroxymethyldihydropteridine diphosphokinase n=1 Tax=Thiothrix subterranea TaxID=2735563 RepID=UPI00192C86CB|nr:2-amino-4-hydroxy-6-hydroxymethyldihydropteridine diphosphokinase [Thiothrix subterranea]QQZ29997.1 2-amino-4-hydroxy-6-hydroxymethyldihydropteridine diphosphokinase [Thiothrix subterranea]